MKIKIKLICAVWVIYIQSVAFVLSERYHRIKENDIGFSFSLVNLESVQSQLECFRHCNSDDNCRGVSLVQETNGLNCFMMKKGSGNQDLAGVQVYFKGN